MSERDQASSFLIARGTARAFTVEQGQVVRLVQPEPGGQVADLVPFNRQEPRERLWGSRTAWRFGVHLTTGAQLISTGPWERPLLTISADSLSREPTAGGARFHDVLMGCCSRRLLVQLWGPDYDRPGCHDLLSAAIAPLGLSPDLVHDTWNVFMRTGFDGSRPFLEPTDVATGDFVELRAEQDLIIAISACQGRSSQPDSTGLRVLIEPPPGEGSGP
jgi:uncharacterized protein YcgI (DUF1989 family)